MGLNSGILQRFQLLAVETNDAYGDDCRDQRGKKDKGFFKKTKIWRRAEESDVDEERDRERKSSICVPFFLFVFSFRFLCFLFFFSFFKCFNSINFNKYEG